MLRGLWSADLGWVVSQVWGLAGHRLVEMGSPGTNGFPSHNVPFSRRLTSASSHGGNRFPSLQAEASKAS